jgi:hypothetical protein
MPAPLPTDIQPTLRLYDSPLMRLEALSFFVLVILLCSAAVWGLWNYLRRDFTHLPRLSFGKAIAAVVLWGLLFVVVLTMISGARELMTPGAWRKQGFTYKLEGAPTPAGEPSPQAVRRRRLENLRTALWQFAALHNGRFPREDERTAIAAELWEVPDTGGMRYLYIPGRSANHAAGLLAYEPELDSNERFVLRANGDILTMKSAEVRVALKDGRRP